MSLSAQISKIASMSLKPVAVLLLCTAASFCVRAQDQDQDQVSIPESLSPECSSEVKAGNTFVALKTNLLYYAVTSLNLEAEVPVGRSISILAEDLFPWWEWANKYCLQLWELGTEARYWFTPWNTPGTEKFKGFFAGAYGMSGKYDFQFDTAFNYQGEFWSAGLSGGWSTVIGRTGWGRLELSVRLGYLQTDWRHYYPTESYDKLIQDKTNAGRSKYWGPTKAAVSLVIPINTQRCYLRSS